MFNKHKFGKVQDDGYQYCEKCGEAIIPPCNHDWRRVSEVTIKNCHDNIIGEDYIFECKKCHAIRQEQIRWNS